MPDGDKSNEKKSARDGAQQQGWTVKGASNSRTSGKHGTGPRVAPPLVKTSRKPPGGKPGGSKRV